MSALVSEESFGRGVVSAEVTVVVSRVQPWKALEAAKAKSRVLMSVRITILCRLGLDFGHMELFLLAASPIRHAAVISTRKVIVLSRAVCLEESSNLDLFCFIAKASAATATASPFLFKPN